MGLGIVIQFVMKNQAGIDLSNLTEAQRKMCVRLLAMNNVQFTEDKDTYVATLCVPNSDITTYINNCNSDNQLKKYVKKEQVLKPNNMGLKQKGNIKEKSVGKASTAATKESVKMKSSKKPLFKVVKLPQIPKLSQLYPEIQIYIYPKRLPLALVQQQIQQLYEYFWQRSKENPEISLAKSFIEMVSLHSGAANKSKNDQNLVNLLQTINHFRHKEVGIRIFYMFLAGQYTQEQLSYFMVLRALIEQFVGQKIFSTKPKIPSNNTFSSCSSLTGAFVKGKLKWNPFQKQIHQSLCYGFLKVVVSNGKSADEVFDKLTERMYYCESKKGNFIMLYDLMDFMLTQFDKECVGDSVANLELSYSNNDSTLKDILTESAHRTFQRPLKTKFEIQLGLESLKDHEKQVTVEEPQVYDNGQILLSAAIEKAKDMCRRVQISQQHENEIVERVVMCVESLRTMDKMKWVEAMEIQGTQEQLSFIEQLQIHYKNSCLRDSKLTMVNSLVKRIFGGPGFIRIFSSFIVF